MLKQILSKIRDLSKPLLPIAVVIVVVAGIFAWSNGKGVENVQAVQLSDNYYTFTETKYNELSGKSGATMLNFYADWCASCNAMEPDIIDIFSEIGISRNVSGFRVNFGDNAETQSGKELADSFGIKTQSSVIILTSEGKVFKEFFSIVDRETLRNTLISASLVSAQAN